MNLFVYRIAKRYEGGIVKDSCPKDFNKIYKESLSETLINTELSLFAKASNEIIIVPLAVYIEL